VIPAFSAVLPLARAYAAHAGRPRDEAELRADLSAVLSDTGALSRALMTAGALFVRGAAPAVYLGRWTGFASLSADERERLLEALQREGAPAIRGLFLGIKPLLLALCYP
jgi:uncharacterized membrane protein